MPTRLNWSIRLREVNTIFSKLERKTANFRQKHNKAACPISFSRHLALALIG
jgi:hypothetical protein